jgi:hypothetical protein
MINLAFILKEVQSLKVPDNTELVGQAEQLLVAHQNKQLTDSQFIELANNLIVERQLLQAADDALLEQQLAKYLRLAIGMLTKII